MSSQPHTESSKPERAISKLWLAILVVLFAGATFLTVSNSGRSVEPEYGGKKLRQWLLEVDYGQPEATRTAAQVAIGHMGTNVLPFVLRDLSGSRSALPHHLNTLLAKVPGLKFKFTTADDHARRAVWALDALGAHANAAIPEIQKLLLITPGYVPSALAAIGTDSIPALQQCLTNDSRFYIPGNTIGAIHNAMASGRIPRAHAATFLPEVSRWAASTNSHAVWYATNFLKTFSPTVPTAAVGTP